MRDSPWPAADARLRALWDSGLSTCKIGEAMGLTKGAIVGRAHRLGLIARPSPVIRDGIVRKPPAPRVPAGVATLPPLISPGVAMPAPVSAVVVPMRTVDPAPVPTALPKPGHSRHGCCWPIGDPKVKGFRYCGEAADLGRSYCDRHDEIAYVRVAKVRWA